MNYKIVIVGASSGIGLGVTEELLSQGHSVLALGRSLQNLEKLSLKYPKTLQINQYDLQTAKSQSQLPKWLENFSDVDIFFLNAGIATDDNLTNWERGQITLNTNIIGTTEFLFTAIQYFRLNKRVGTIAVNSSIAGLRGLRQAPLYAASKAFLVSLFQSLRSMRNQKNEGINFVDIRPGFVDTKMAGGSFWLTPLPKASRQIAAGILNKKPILYVSRRWIFMAFFMRIIPRFIYERV